MDEFLDRVSDTVMTAGRVVSDKAKNVTDITKAKYELSTKESELKDKYRLIGERFYEEHRDDHDASYDEVFGEIEGLKNEIEDINDRIVGLKGSRLCPSCGAEVSEGANFCTKCGSALNK